MIFYDNFDSSLTVSEVFSESGSGSRELNIRLADDVKGDYRQMELALSQAKALRDLLTAFVAKYEGKE